MGNLLTVSNLKVAVESPDGSWHEAISNVSLQLNRGESLGLVGESGCGKSLTLLSILGLLPKPSVRQLAGRICFDGQELNAGDETAFRALRGSRIGYIPQDPMSALNPVFTVGNQLAEAVLLHHDLSRRSAWERSAELLSQVGIATAASRLKAYPHQLSGGQRQRVLIAMALAGDPELIVADEPTTALDVTVQAQVLQLLAELQDSRGMALLLVTHDLAVVSEVCDQVTILYAGNCAESGPARAVLNAPHHPYTRALLRSMPGHQPAGQERLNTILGQVPSVGYWPSGCRFRDRCSRAEIRCAKERPEMLESASNRFTACHFSLAGEDNV
jgi:oligopeptide/dipeptide ABC transporter ATP-binding protein